MIPRSLRLKLAISRQSGPVGDCSGMQVDFSMFQPLQRKVPHGWLLAVEGKVRKVRKVCSWMFLSNYPISWSPLGHGGLLRRVHIPASP